MCFEINLNSNFSERMMDFVSSPDNVLFFSHENDEINYSLPKNRSEIKASLWCTLSEKSTAWEISGQIMTEIQNDNWAAARWMFNVFGGYEGAFDSERFMLIPASNSKIDFSDVVAVIRMLHKPKDTSEIEVARQCSTQLHPHSLLAKIMSVHPHPIRVCEIWLVPK